MIRVFNGRAPVGIGNLLISETVIEVDNEIFQDKFLGLTKNCLKGCKVRNLPFHISGLGF